MKVRIEKYIEYNVVGFLIFTLFSDLKKVYFNITFEVVLKYTFLTSKVILKLERESPYSMIF